MSVQATLWVWNYSQSRNGTRLVALAIADAANPQGAESCQSIATLVRMTGLAESTVHEAIRWLLDHGEVVCDGDNPRYRNTRIYHFPSLTRGPDSGPQGSEQLPLGVQITPEKTPESGPEPKLQTPVTTDPRARSRATTVPDDFVIDSPMAQWWLAKNRPDINLDAELEQFLDYHRAKGTAFKDWTAAWRTWMNNAIRYHGNGNPPASHDDRPRYPV